MECHHVFVFLLPFMLSIHSYQGFIYLLRNHSFLVLRHMIILNLLLLINSFIKSSYVPNIFSVNCGPKLQKYCSHGPWSSLASLEEPTKNLPAK